MRRALPLAALLALASCFTMPPRAPSGILEEIEAAEITAQELSASATNLTCTKFVAGNCVEPGKAFSPDAGLRYQQQFQDVRKALRTAKALGKGGVAECLGAARAQAACLAAAKGLMAELEQQVLQAQQGAKP